MRFEWDEQKNKSNLRKHGVGFEFAVLAFDDPHALLEQDREVDGEERWWTIGLARGEMLIFAAHTMFDEDDDLVIRLISARRATSHERKMYEQGRR